MLIAHIIDLPKSKKMIPFEAIENVEEQTKGNIKSGKIQKTKHLLNLQQKISFQDYQFQYVPAIVYIKDFGSNMQKSWINYTTCYEGGYTLSIVSLRSSDF